MMKKTKKKGFTLIEILIVIAAIAILVAVVIPMFSQSSVKAAAAANAANLRSIESQVTMALLQNPENFTDFLDQGETMSSASEGILGKFYDFIFGDGAAAENQAKYHSLVDNGNREIIIPRSGTVIPNVNTSKGLEAPHRNGGTGLVVAENVTMRVYITEEGAMAAYGDWNKDDFADVAEDGYYDGELKSGTGGSGGGGGFKEWVDSVGCKSVALQGKHTPGSDCKCLYCGTEAHFDADRTEVFGITIEYMTSTTKHACRCGYVFNADHLYGDGSHECTYENCTVSTPCVDVDPNGGYVGGLIDEREDHKCYICNEPITTNCSDSRGGGTLSNKPNHKCDVCDRVMTECSWQEMSSDATQHECTICGTTASHSYSNGTCSSCGKTLPTCKFSGCGSTDVKADGYCGSHQQKPCTRQVISSGWLGDSVSTCSGKYRGTVDDCTNASSHISCPYSGCGATSGLKDDGYCSNHQEKNCDICDADYRGSACTATHGTCPVTDCGAASKDNSTNCNNHKNYKYCDTHSEWYDSGSGWNTNECPKCEKDDGGSSGGGGCVTPDTLITLADGSTKRIDEVTYSDYLLVWDFYKGDYAVVPAAIIFDHGYDNNTVIALNFSDGTTVKVVNLHQFYDTDLNTLATINAENVAEYVGHGFAKQGNQTVELVSYAITEEYVEAFGIISAVHYNIFVEGMLSADFMPEDYDLFTYFEFGSDMKYDQAQMEADIAEYGLYTYEEFADYLTYEQFVGFNVPYMKVAVGKGNYTYEGILNLIDFYLSSEA